MNNTIYIIIILTILVLGSIGKRKVVFNDFLLVFQFITRLPINISLQCEKENFKKGTLYFSAVGAIIGILEYGVYFLCSRVLPLPMVAVITVLSGIFITGGLHMDGLGDTCDGFFSFRSRERIIEIMKDSRVGTFGVIAVIIDILLKVVGVYYAGAKGMEYMIIVIPCISRLTLGYLSLVGRTAKETGTGNLYIKNTNIVLFIGSCIIAIALGAIFYPVKIIFILVIIALLISSLFNLYCISKIGGLSGDTLGANNEIIEIILFIIISSTLF